VNYSETSVNVLREVRRKLEAVAEEISACTHMSAQAQTELDIDVIGQNGMEDALFSIQVTIEDIGRQVDRIEEENETENENTNN
jgi:hypothetical protein